MAFKRSFRWPLKRNRGFSATPRSRWGRASKATAKAIVRKAGPLQTEWFVDSSLVVDTDTASVAWCVASNFKPPSTLIKVMDHSVWNTNLSTTREKCYLMSATVTCRLRAVGGADNAPYFREFQQALAFLDPDQTSTLAVDDAWPTQFQSSMIFYEEAPPAERLATRVHTRNLVHPADPGAATMWELGQDNPRQHATITHRFKGKKLLSDEMNIYVVSNSVGWSTASGSETSIGGVIGWWTARFKLARF